MFNVLFMHTIYLFFQTSKNSSSDSKMVKRKFQVCNQVNLLFRGLVKTWRFLHMNDPKALLSLCARSHCPSDLELH